MNANTALKINDAIAQAVECGETEGEIKAQVERALNQALRAKYETAIIVAQHQLSRLPQGT